ncbi:SRPBCC domain-containing protein [Streptomyces sp. NPDC046939]|uniref:SRPBCC domain-containing protein n=1 Tax=Streptomyces sp. NPDC046939 TaxID=3155376 RepID=UPI0033F10808
MTEPRENLVPAGISRTDGTVHTLFFTLRLPHPVEQVWRAVATPEGLEGWLAAADVLEPRLGGAVTLRWLNGGGAHQGRITAWDVERVAEYTLGGVHGRIRCHLEPATTLRFTNEFDGDDALRLDCLAGWHDHFLHLLDALDGRPMTGEAWQAWTPERWRSLRERYAAR